MDNRLINFLLAFIFSCIGVGDGTIQSGYWRKEGNHHWHNTTGEVVYSTTARGLSDCVSICQDSTACLMCGHSIETGTCHGFSYLETNLVSILEESEVIYQHTESCVRAGYVLLGDGPLCVKKHDDALTWNDAKTQCEQYHGRLVVIDNAQKLEAFVNYLENITSAVLWIGVNDKDSEGSWVWLNGASLITAYLPYYQLNNYSAGYPGKKNNADCAWMSKSGGLVDDNCLLKNSYMCERADLV
ncbi:uncharacterized protein LOC110451077 [Mizuhopecten yessoensis]|uniref:uncharacterized protein LOC110451077 n=1 Tax=Mizuhopecten yessoensis TaxID=6573 RepID=UPI000B4586ED|nr:uncharacterized protein LOC110451077 [Mizuhopecten yessoensis]